jgi:hypothetical protein
MVDDDGQLSGVLWPVAGGWWPMDAGVEGMADGRRSILMIPPGTAVRGAYACYEVIVSLTVPDNPRLTSYCWFQPLLPSSTIWMSSSTLALDMLVPALTVTLVGCPLASTLYSSCFCGLGDVPAQIRHRHLNDRRLRLKSGSKMNGRSDCVAQTVLGWDDWRLLLLHWNDRRIKQVDQLIRLDSGHYRHEPNMTERSDCRTRELARLVNKCSCCTKPPVDKTVKRLTRPDT